MCNHGCLETSSIHLWLGGFHLCDRGFPVESTGLYCGKEKYTDGVLCRATYLNHSTGRRDPREIWGIMSPCLLPHTALCIVNVCAVVCCISCLHTCSCPVPCKMVCVHELAYIPYMSQRLFLTCSRKSPTEMSLT